MNPPFFGPSWLPKIGAIVCVVGVGIRKHHNPSVAFWADILEQLGILVTGWSVRQNGVSSEQAGAIKSSDPAAASVASTITKT